MGDRHSGTCHRGAPRTPRPTSRPTRACKVLAPGFWRVLHLPPLVLDRGHVGGGQRPDGVGERAGERGGVVARHHPRVARADDLGQSAGVGDDNRAARCHRLSGDQPEGLGPHRGDDRQVDTGEELLRRDPARLLDPHARGGQGGLHRTTVGGGDEPVVAGDHQLYPRAQRGLEHGARRGQHVHTLLQPDPADEPDRDPVVATRPPGLARPPVGPVGEHLGRGQAVGEVAGRHHGRSGADPRDPGQESLEPARHLVQVHDPAGPAGGGERGEQTVAPQHALAAAIPAAQAPARRTAGRGRARPGRPAPPPVPLAPGGSASTGRPR